jgi:hypothetical protein
VGEVIALGMVKSIRMIESEIGYRAVKSFVNLKRSSGEAHIYYGTRREPSGAKLISMRWTFY